MSDDNSDNRPPRFRVRMVVDVFVDEVVEADLVRETFCMLAKSIAIAGPAVAFRAYLDERADERKTKDSGEPSKPKGASPLN